MDTVIAALKERAWRQTAAIDADLAAGRIDEAGWHAAMAALVGPAYLAASSPFGQAGHSGDAASWEASRGFIRHALHTSGTFLDAGCASGVMMESVVRWGEGRGLVIEPHGVEIVPELAALARRRLPHWAGRIHSGNVRRWQPPPGVRFDFVLIRPEYAPPGRCAELVRHLLTHVVAPGGRLIVFVGTEETANRQVETELAAAGFAAHGRVERPHPQHPALCRRLLWIQRTGHGSDGVAESPPDPDELGAQPG